jgi:protein-tyrosine phosphatase
MYLVPRSGPGRLSTMARPRGNDWLNDEMSGLRDAGVDVLVLMLTPIEADELDLQREAEAASVAGLDFVSCPTPDRGVPDAERFRDLLRELEVALNRGQNVVMHCRMGIGRSSLVAAGLLVSEGMAGSDAWEAVSTARGMPVPDTDEQRTWLLEVMRDQ